MSKTKIEWTDATWNPVTGCTAVSPGCDHCYARAMARRFAGRAGYPAAPHEFDVTLHPERLAEPLRWRKPRRVFVVSMGDLFHQQVPDEFIDRVWAVMAACPQHTFQVLTKRPARMLEYLRGIANAEPGVIDRVLSMPGWCMRDTATVVTYRQGGALPNVWLGVTAEDQQRADERVPLLLQTPAAVRFVSCEPLLSHVNLVQYLYDTRSIGACDGRAGNLLSGCGGDSMEASRRGCADTAPPRGYGAAQSRELSQGAVHNQREALCSTSSSLGLDGQLGTPYSGNHGDQSSRREQREQSSSESRIGHESRECSAQLPGSGSKGKGAAGQQEYICQARRGEGSADPRGLQEPGNDATDVGGAVRSVTANDLGNLHTQNLATRPLAKLDWVICGGETGIAARPMAISWARSLRDQCQASGVPFFFKSHGQSNREPKGGSICLEQIRHTLDGVEHHAYPEVAA